MNKHYSGYSKVLQAYVVPRYTRFTRKVEYVKLIDDDAIFLKEEEEALWLAECEVEETKPKPAVTDMSPEQKERIAAALKASWTQ